MPGVPCLKNPNLFVFRLPGLDMFLNYFKRCFGGWCLGAKLEGCHFCYFVGRITTFGYGVSAKLSGRGAILFNFTVA